LLEIYRYSGFDIKCQDVQTTPVWTDIFALAADRCNREPLDWHLSRSGQSKTAEAAWEQALITRFGTLGTLASLPTRDSKSLTMSLISALSSSVTSES
jgi:hypothetical protein